MGFETYRTSSGTKYEIPLNATPYGNNRTYVDEQTGQLWSSTIETPPMPYTSLIKVR